MKGGKMEGKNMVLSEQIRQIQAGDEDAFSKFFETNRDMIYRYIYRYIGNKVDSEDIAIETFVKFHHNIDKVDASRNIRAYLFRIAHNLVVDFFRKYKYTVQLNEDIATGSEEGRDTEKELIHELLEKLPDTYRDLIILKYLEKYSNEDIADIKGKSLDSIKSSLKRARKKLIKLFNKLQ